ncbi:hypothetical protein SADUNF_Sadunf08G0063000 [Salix dunnii]|uniref:EF-hand domain-containing protein n=1 Tax=Salix dunnii TaxID=1413687 RepID=A0A835JT85_9ROSI|nr:hypothetical protein SADUNF_Sadunf08G0063000 [Salix dunnii]
MRKRNKPKSPCMPRGCFSRLTEEQLREIFKKFDISQDGRLSKEELKQAFGDLGAAVPAYRAIRGLSQADANHDGFVDMEELDELVKYAYRLGYQVI